MGNKYSQTEEAKREFTSPLLTYMKAVNNYEINHVFTKDELRGVLSCSDRHLRHEMEKIANYYPIVATSDSKGYRLLVFTDSMDLGDLDEISKAYEHQLAELNSRVNSLYARMNPIIAAKVEIDRLIQIRTEK